MSLLLPLALQAAAISNWLTVELKSLATFFLIWFVARCPLQLQLASPLPSAASQPDQRYAKIGENVFWHLAGSITLVYIVHNFSPSPAAHPLQNMLATLRLLSLLRVMLPNVFWLINVSRSTSSLSLSSSVTICVSFDMRSRDTHGRAV